jgi:tetratricopeptide (TPR) repeat protein
MLFEENNPFIQIHDKHELHSLYQDTFSHIDPQKLKLIIQAILKKEPYNLTVWLKLARLYSELDQDEYSILCYKHVLELDKTNLEALLNLAILCLNELNTVDSMIYLKNWVCCHPVYSNYKKDCKLILNELPIKKHEVECEDFCEKYKKVDNLSNAYIQEMYCLIEKIYKDHPQELNILISLGLCSYAADCKEKSIEIFRMASEGNPKDHIVLNIYGSTLLSAGKIEEAILIFRQALILNPKYAKCWTNLGICHFQKAEYKEAINCFVKALSVNDQIEHVWLYLTKCFKENENLLDLIDEKNLSEIIKHFETM